MNEFTHLNAYSLTDVPHRGTGTPRHPVAGDLRHGRRRSTRHAVASRLHRLADRLDS